MTEKRLKFVVPGDFPPQIQGSPHLDRLQPYGDVDLYLDRPRDMAEQLERVQGAHVILNTRGLSNGLRLRSGPCRTCVSLLRVLLASTRTTLRRRGHAVWP